MPYVLTFNKDVIEKKVIKITDYLNFKEKSFDSFLNWILELRNEFNIPHKLSDLIDKDNFDIKKLSEMALNDPSTNGNPKKLSLKDMIRMYENSMSGKLF